MAKVRLTDSEPRMVPWIGDRIVQPDEVIEVPDGDFDAYVCQSGIWQAVEEPRGHGAPRDAAAKAASAPKRTSSTENADSNTEGGE